MTAFVALTIHSQLPQLSQGITGSYPTSHRLDDRRLHTIVFNFQHANN